MSADDFFHLVRRHRDRVFNLAFYSLRHREDAEDVTQEVLLRLWNHRARLDEARLGAWLIKVTRNACYDLLRRHRTRRSRFDESRPDEEMVTFATEAPDPLDHAEGADFRRRLEVALRRLPEPCRSAVVLREIEGMKYDEIADALGKPLNSIKVYIHRGRRMLREELKDLQASTAASEDDARSPTATTPAARTPNRPRPQPSPEPHESLRLLTPEAAHAS
ncbi:MAG: sigma-70 family RNA polymerase sigma factor [Acidobacteriota bacterium]